MISKTIHSVNNSFHTNQTILQFGKIQEKLLKICFVIGGSFGLDNNILKKSQKVLSASNFTFPHRLFRIILIEQIYRAFSIINNSPYHK